MIRLPIPLYGWITALGVLSANLLAAQEASPPSLITEKITVYALDGDGPPNLVSNGLPMKPGALRDLANIRILDGQTEVPLATQALAYWPHDHSIRSVLIQFEAGFRGKTKTYTLQLGRSRTTSDRPLVPVTWALPTRLFSLSADYLSESLITWEQKPLGKTGFPAWDKKQLENFSSVNRRISSSVTCPNADLYYDSISTQYQLYARTGDPRYLVNARRWALHYRRDQIWLSGPNIGHTRCGDVNGTRYVYVQALVYDYFFFGDAEARRVAGLIVDNFLMQHGDSYYYVAPNTRRAWTEREPAYALMGILAYYEATGNAAYLREVQRRVGLLHRMQVENGRRAWVHNLHDHDPNEGCQTTDWGSSPWMSGLLLEAVVQYHKLTRDPMAVDSITMALDDLMTHYLATKDHAGRSFIYLGCSRYTEGTPDLDNLIAHAYGYGYAITGKPEYRKVGMDLFNTSVRSGWSGDFRHYNQQFRSSGYFVAYVSSGYEVPGVAVDWGE